MEYMTATETAEKWGISTRRVHTLCAEGRIKGATRLGNAWAIPKNAEKPKDARIKSGKYISK
jgi:predicted site-specific integrase-resolvase